MTRYLRKFENENARPIGRRSALRFTVVLTAQIQRGIAIWKDFISKVGMKPK